MEPTMITLKSLFLLLLTTVHSIGDEFTTDDILDKSYSQCSDACEAKGERLPTKKELMDYLGGSIGNIDSWTPIANSYNEWLQIGNRLQKPIHHYGKLHSSIGKPAWGTQSVSKYYKRKFYCYKSNIHLSANNIGSKSYSQCKQSCQSEGNQLANIQQVKYWLGGWGAVGNIDSWTPVVDSYNEWLQIGNKVWDYGKLHSSLGKPGWGTQAVSYSFKRKFYCVVVVTNNPSLSPTENPTITPTKIPTKLPSSNPSFQPSKSPSRKPTMAPSNNPTVFPTKTPTQLPSFYPTVFPTKIPSDIPTSQPSLDVMYESNNYIGIPKLLNTDEAALFCKQNFNSYLATVLEESDQTEIETQILKRMYEDTRRHVVHVGYKDFHGVAKWLHGQCIATNVLNELWHSTATSPHKQQCGYFNLLYPLHFDIGSCALKRFFVCDNPNGKYAEPVC